MDELKELKNRAKKEGKFAPIHIYNLGQYYLEESKKIDLYSLNEQIRLKNKFEKLNEQAARAGCEEAQICAGKYYLQKYYEGPCVFNGTDLQAYYKELSIGFLDLAATQGNEEAKKILSNLKIDVSKYTSNKVDEDEPIVIFEELKKKAKKEGKSDPIHIYNLGQYYFNESKKKVLYSANTLYKLGQKFEKLNRQAAMAGCEEAQICAGKFYLERYNYAKEHSYSEFLQNYYKNQAKEFLDLAANEGNEEAKQLLDKNNLLWKYGKIEAKF